MVTRREVEETKQSAQGIAMLAKELGYEEQWSQLLFPNGASATNLIEFLDDNPGACEAIVNWVLERGCHRDGEPILDEEDDDDMCNCGHKVNSPECASDPHDDTD